MARLTRKLDNGRYGQNYTTGDGFMVGMTEMMQKLGRLEDLQEAGRLVELPCAVSDTVYGIFCGKVYPKNITRIEINPHTNPKLWMGTKFDFSSGTIDRIDMVLGKTVFLTREEAEAALKGGGRNEP